MDIYHGDIAVDDRGKVTFCNDFDFKDVKRFYMVENHEKGFVRAWHGHKKEGKYVFVPRGWIILATVSMEDEELERYVLSADKPRVLYIPPGFYNGFKTMTEDTQVIFFSTSTLEDSKGDDVRKPAHWHSYVWLVIEQ